MATTPPQLPATSTTVLSWLKYFIASAVPIGIIAILIALLPGADHLQILVGALVVTTSLFVLWSTTYLKHWNDVPPIIRIFGWLVPFVSFVAVPWAFLLLAVLFPILKPRVDKLGSEKSAPAQLPSSTPRTIGLAEPAPQPAIDTNPHQELVIASPQQQPASLQVSVPQAQTQQATPQQAPSRQATTPLQSSVLASKSWLASYIKGSLPADFFQNINVYSVMAPKNIEWQPERALRLIEHILNTLDWQVTLQIIAEHDKIQWRLLDIGALHSPGTIIHTIRAIYPEAEVVYTPYEPVTITQPFARIAGMVLQQRDFEFPLRSVLEFKQIDPLATIVNHLSDIPAGVRVTNTVHIKGILPDTMRQEARNRITKFVIPGFTLNTGGIISLGLELGVRAVTGNSREAKYVNEDQKILDHRIMAEHLCVTYFLQQLDIAEDFLQSGYDAGGLTGAYTGINALNSEYNGFKGFPATFREEDIVTVTTPDVEQKTSAVGLIGLWGPKLPHKPKPTDLNNIRKWTMVLTPREIAALWHLPHGEFTAPEIQWLKGAKAPSEIAKNLSGVHIGNNDYAGQKNPIYLGDKDRTTGMYVLGKPGMGKSTYMHSLIHQDIQRGFGVAVVDPHGKLVNDILGISIPINRENDLVVIDLNYDDVPAPLNPLIIPNEPGQIAVGRVLAAMRTVYDLSRAERALNALKSALVTLAVEPTPTLRDIIRLFNDPAYRDQIKKLAQGTVKDRLTWEFWQDYEALTSTNAQQELVYPVVHRLRSLYGNDFLYPMLCNPDTLDIAEMIAQKKIVLVSLHTDKDKVPEDERRLIGAILVSTFQMAGMKSFREGAPNFYLYIDEVQNFVTTSIGTALTEARKYGLSLHMANQFLDQLKGDTLKAVLGAIGSMVVFQVGHDDARELAPYFQLKSCRNWPESG